MKVTGLVIILLFNINILIAQSTQSSVTYNKVSQPALMLDLPYSQSTSEDFIIDNLKRTGYNVESKGKLFWKQNKLNGFYTFKGVNLEGLSQSVDLYFNVEQRSKRDKNESVIYLMVSKGNENFISPDSDPDIYNAARKLLDGFVTQSAAYKLDLDIKAQEDAVRTAEKKLSKLQDNEHDLNKKLDQLQNDLRKNKNDQENQQRSLENERRRLADLKSKGTNP